MSIFPLDHPQRLALADEVHARPPEPLPTPARVSYVAVLTDGRIVDWSVVGSVSRVRVGAMN